jgi:hypothetical protein
MLANRPCCPQIPIVNFWTFVSRTTYLLLRSFLNRRVGGAAPPLCIDVITTLALKATSTLYLGELSHYLSTSLSHKFLVMIWLNKLAFRLQVIVMGSSVRTFYNIGFYISPLKEFGTFFFFSMLHESSNFASFQCK